MNKKEWTLFIFPAHLFKKTLFSAPLLDLTMLSLPWSLFLSRRWSIFPFSLKQRCEGGWNHCVFEKEEGHHNVTKKQMVDYLFIRREGRPLSK